jgi:hypothetical protein
MRVAVLNATSGSGSVAAVEAARGMETWVPLWVRLMQRFGTADFNLRLVR